VKERKAKKKVKEQSIPKSMQDLDNEEKNKVEGVQ